MAMFNEEYYFYKKLNELKYYKGAHTELVSFYISYKRSIQDAVDQLKREKTESSNIKNKANKDKVCSAIDRIINSLKQEFDLTNGLCIFSSEQDVFVLQPPKANTLNKYICGKSFYLDPLKTLYTGADNVYGLVALDGSECTIAKLEGKKLTICHQLDSHVTNRTIKGGQSARRYRNARQESVYYYFKEVADLINNTFNPDVTKIYFGGIIPASEEFLKYINEFTPLLKDKYSNCIPLPYTDTMGIKILLEKVNEEIEEKIYEKAKEHKILVQKKIENHLETNIDDFALKEIYIAEDKIQEILFTEKTLNKVKINVCEIDSPLYEYITFFFNGLLYLK
jgi:peptide chain release factor 1